MTTQMPGQMRAAVYHGPRDIRFARVAIPSPAHGELLLRVGAVGVCGTDAAEWAHGPSMFPITHAHRVTGHQGPMIPGHEFAGSVVGIGQGVDASWIGHLVSSCGSMCCGTCTACKSGRSNWCSEFCAVGLHRNGALAEYVVVPAASCIDVTDLGLSAAEAALGQPMAIAVHAAARSGVGPGDRALVQGIGGIGAFLVHVLVRAGVSVIAADRAAERLAIAADLGAEACRLVDGTDDISVLQEAGGHRCAVIFEVSGSASGLTTALELLPMGGRLVLVGIQERPSQVLLRQLTLREQTLIGTNALVREIDFPKAVELIAASAGRWSGLAPEPLPIGSLVESVLLPMSEGRPPAIKTLIDPSV